MASSKEEEMLLKEKMELEQKLADMLRLQQQIEMLQGGLGQVDLGGDENIGQKEGGERQDHQLEESREMEEISSINGEQIGQDTMAMSPGRMEAFAQINSISNAIEELGRAYDNGGKQKDAGQLEEDLIQIMQLGKQLEAFSKLANSADSGAENDVADEYGDDEEFAEGEGEGEAGAGDSGYNVKENRSSQESPVNEMEAQQMLEMLLHLQQVQQAQQAQSGLIGGGLNDQDSFSEREKELARSSREAAFMLDEVRKLREDIGDLKDNGDEDNVQMLQQREQKFMQLVAKLEQLEQRKEHLTGALDKERALQINRQQNHYNSNNNNTTTTTTTTTTTNNNNNNNNNQQQEEDCDELSNKKDNGNDNVKTKQEIDEKEEEIVQMRLALEQARELGRRKSLQLKRQEQEVALLQREIDSMEGRLMSVGGTQGGNSNSSNGNASFENNTLDGQPEMASSVRVEVSSVKSSSYFREQSASSQTSSPGNSQDLENDVDTRDDSLLGRSDDDDDNDDDDDDHDDDDDDDEDSGDDSDGERYDEFQHKLNDQISLLPPRIRVTHGIRSKSRKKKVDEVSTSARAGSTTGDFSETVSEDAYPLPASPPLDFKGGEHISERDTTSETSYPGAMNGRRAGGKGNEGFQSPSNLVSASNMIPIPSDQYLDPSDWRLLLANIHDFIEDSRALDQESSDHDDSVTDHMFGREMLNFFTRICSELGHVNIRSTEQQRQIIKALRRLSLS